ncbi:MAG: cytochrome c1 [Alphaproteobacteria bacterium]|nr:cytochrome c1 [Alphaproteobacteria bacterium]
MRKIVLTALAVAAACFAGSLPASSSEAIKPPSQSWGFGGIFGTFDRAALQRGFHVYKDVCAACHSMNLLAYRNLRALGFSEDEVKGIAAEYEVTDGPNDEGNMFQRAGRPSDRFKAPFANEKAARAANNGAFPPDLSLMIKARPSGANYVHALLTGYEPPPPSVKLMEGMNYNKFFPGGQIAMAPPLNADAVTFGDGTPATVAQMSKDVVTFLAWAAEPELEVRKQMGVKVILFLIVLTIMLYAAKRRTWAGVH